jgi:hypothetical protein
MPLRHAPEPVCPRCRAGHQLDLGANAHRCLSCGHGWRWAVCGHCQDLARPAEGLQSWRCGECHGYNRSYWKTSMWAAEAAAVAARRVADRRRARGRRLPLLLVVPALLALALAVMTGAASGQGGQAASAACNRLARMVSDEASGTLSGTQVQQRVSDIERLASQAGGKVAAEAARLRGAAERGPGDDGFRAAVTAMARACEEGHRPPS